MNSLKKKFILTGFIIAIIAALASSIITSTRVFGYAGGSVPSPAVSGCSYTRYSTCYGAGWMKYSVNENPSGTTRLANGDLQVWGTGQGAGSGVIETTKCNDDGYYWRLAFYIDDYYFGSPTQASNGYWYYKNDQIGLMEVGWSHDYYMTIYNEAEAYADWQKLDASMRSGYTWNGLNDRTSTLSWFCSENRITESTVTWQSYSAVSLHNSSGTLLKSDSTGWDSEKTNVTYEFDSNNTETAYVEFDHYLKRDKSDPSNATAQYKVTGDGISNPTVSSWSGNSTTGENVYSNSNSRIAVSVGPEQETTVCQTIYHDSSKVYQDTTLKTNNGYLDKNSKICITVRNKHLKESTVTWQSYSGVSLYSAASGGTLLKSDNTGWDSEKTNVTYEFNSGDTETAYVVFDHYLKRDLVTIPSGLKAKYKITGDSAPNENNWSAGSTTGQNIYSSPSRIPISVSPGGTATLCQTAYHTGSKVFNKNGALDSSFPLDKSSRICITVKNIGSSMVYSSSNTSISGELTAATGIKSKDQPTTKSTSVYNINLKNGPQTKTIMFWHNAYAASRTNTQLPVIVRRTLSTTLNGSTSNTNSFVSDRYDVSYPFTGAQSYSANNTDYQSSTVNTKFTTTYSDPAYIADTRSYTDSQNNKFIHRDVYSVQFRSEGTYKFCETILVNGSSITTACAVVNVKEDISACPDWLPDSYTNSGLYEGTTTTVSGVKNTNLVGANGAYTLSNGTNFDTKPVWAKPGDLINWRHCYFPGVQKVAWAKATKNNREYNMYNSIFGTWENKWSVSQQQLTANNTYDSGELGYGIATVRDWNDSYTVETGARSRAGKSLTETSSSGIPSYAKVVNKVGSRTNKSATDKVMVKVPYNFINSASVQLKDGAVYSGETATISDDLVTVGTRHNATTNGTYATTVRNADIRLYAYTSASSSGGGGAIAGYSAPSKDTGVLCNALSYSYNNCQEVDKNTSTINSPEITSGTSLNKFKGRTYNVYDVPAGTYYCVRIAIYPYTSGFDTNMSESGSDTWYISAPSCQKTAKKPSLQVWGNSLYSAGAISTAETQKTNIRSFYDYSTSKNNTTVFGSWVEQSIISRSSQLSGLASGASTGYFGNTTQQRTPKTNLGGSYEGTNAKLCFRSPLTIPKYPCNTGSITSSSNTYSKPSDKSSLISLFIEQASESSNFNYEKSDSDVTIDATEIPAGETRIVHSTGTVTITGNVTYAEGSGYTTLEEIPKLIIYAENNIDINCNVQYVYAILIAENNVKTCANEPETTPKHNAAMNSNQLKIVGSVITDKILPYRTYGSASGIYNSSNSTQTNGKLPDYNLPNGSYTGVIPAEIIDYDTSLYLWGSPRADANNSGKLNVTYQTELAPRY